jgi:hypothetical protein
MRVSSRILHRISVFNEKEGLVAFHTNGPNGEVKDLRLMFLVADVAS